MMEEAEAERARKELVEFNPQVHIPALFHGYTNIVFVSNHSLTLCVPHTYIHNANCC